MSRYNLKTKNIIICLAYLFLIVNTYFAQDSSSSAHLKPTYFISLNIGTQMSGIKDEDFISSNYSPLYNISVGKWFNHQFAIQVGYKGLFYYTIVDDIKHYYNFLYAEAVINFNNFVYPSRKNKIWNILLHTGPGFFYNHTYQKPNICLNIGAQNSFQITNYLQINFDVSSIIGWDIYQGNDDILPGISFGLSYLFQ